MVKHSKRFRLIAMLLAVLAVGVWEYFVYKMTQNPLPAGTCMSVYDNCVSGSTVWGDIFWGGMGLLMILLPAWVIALIGILAARFISQTKAQHKKRKISVA
jgi:predicted acyltransferase